MPDSPYLLEPPAVVSFSGGRTSGYMLWHVLQAHGGTLPPGVVPVFCNTGKERPETLDFVERCSQRWGVEIVWLEHARWAPHKFITTCYAAASRQGQPFDQLIETKQILPNVVMRYCTQHLKIKPSNRYARHVLGFGDGYTNAIGLRADEPRRVAKLRPDPKSTPGEEPIAPLAAAGITKADVMAFWRAQRGGLELEQWLGLPKADRPGWDLELRDHEGNCDLCFLKDIRSVSRIARDRPDLVEWWAEKEQKYKGKTRLFEAGRFRKDRPGYAQILAQVQAQPEFAWPEDERFPECRCTD